MNDIHPIKPVIDLSLFTEGQILFLWGMGALIFGGLLVWGGLWGWKWYQNRPGLPTEEEVRDYRREALGHLQKLKKVIDSGDFDRFYLEVTQVVKGYLSFRYSELIPHLTTQEVMDRSYSERMKELLKSFLMAVDEGKFAKGRRQVHFAEEVWDGARKIINCTK